MIRTEEEHLEHYGTPRRSGRYPWGSGQSETTRNKTLLDDVETLKKRGMTEPQIAQAMGITTTVLRARKSVAIEQTRLANQQQARRLREKGYSHQAIADRMGLAGESSVRALLRDSEKDKAGAVASTTNMLKNQVAEKKYIDVGKGVEAQVGVTQSRLNTAVVALKELGYAVHNIHIPQLAVPGKFTTMKVLAAPGTPKSEIDRNRHLIRQITEYSDDHGQTYFHTQPPLSISQRRVAVNYAEDGGNKVDGVIYIRPGVNDLSIGQARYGQVRIMVDNTHYIKGMAVYKDDLPDGVDVVVNTKKSSTGRKKDVMKEIDPKDPNNPFGAIVRQVHDPDTGKVTSAINLVGSPTKEGSGEEGSWDTWSKSLSSQMLSKQDPKFAQQQLDVTMERRLREFDEINSLTNPTVRKDLLTKFADETDSAAVDLQAASLKRTATKVLLPVPSMKPTEVYAPGFREGERVVLIRHPHGGTFEIPELTVNNKNRDARRIVGPQAQDAIGIHHKVAEHLSGADFDGDTVLVIPNRGKQIKTTPALEELKGFNPMDYKIPKESPIPRMNSQKKGYEMGRVSNLITDMSLKGAQPDELARAVKHSMVVIDAEKHELDYLTSEKDHGIAALREKYQGKKSGGAATLISRARARTYVPARELRKASQGGPIDPVTGRKVFVPTGRTRESFKKDPLTGKKVATGERVPKLERSKRLAETTDAFTLTSRPKPTQMEVIYAEHSNRLKALANTARKETVPIKNIPYSPSAKKTYAKEVESLNSQLRLSERNAPYERQAQLVGNVTLSQKRQATPNMLPEEVKRARQISLNDARARTGANKHRIEPTQAEWNAIQAGAITGHKLERILRNSNPSTIRKLAMPKPQSKMTSTMTRRAEAMLARGYTQQQVADQLGIGLTTLKVGISE